MFDLVLWLHGLFVSPKTAPVELDKLYYQGLRAILGKLGHPLSGRYLDGSAAEFK